jgi:hypothetical protein
MSLRDDQNPAMKVKVCETKWHAPKRTVFSFENKSDHWCKVKRYDADYPFTEEPIDVPPKHINGGLATAEIRSLDDRTYYYEVEGCDGVQEGGSAQKLDVTQAGSSETGSVRARGLPKEVTIP